MSTNIKINKQNQITVNKNSQIKFKQQLNSEIGQGALKIKVKRTKNVKRMVKNDQKIQPRQ